MVGGASELDLLARCRAGDGRAWEELVEGYSGYVYAIVGRGFRLGDHDCEDIFQEVFARFYVHLDSLRDDSAVRFWLAQTARRLAIDTLRRSKRESPVEEEEVLEPAGLDQELERLDEALTVRAYVDELPDHCREVVIRFFIRDQSYRTIGDELSLAPGTIASRISRCLATLRERLEEAG